MRPHRNVQVQVQGGASGRGQGFEMTLIWAFPTCRRLHTEPVLPNRIARVGEDTFKKYLGYDTSLLPPAGREESTFELSFPNPENRKSVIRVKPTRYPDTHYSASLCIFLLPSVIERHRRVSPPPSNHVQATARGRSHGPPRLLLPFCVNVGSGRDFANIALGSPHRRRLLFVFPLARE